jgi:RsiW-degrading membrane proteinase PrsW (M82 family)
MIAVPAHMTFNMVMAEFLGRAKYNKLNGKGSVVLNYVWALLIPIVVHTLYDVCTVFNSSMMRGELSGIIRALTAYVAMLVYEAIVLVRCKKKTEMFCGMSTLAKKVA